MEIKKNYSENKNLRSSFNKLAGESFGLDFSPWYEAGFWGDSYQPYSYVENGEVIANASANLMTLQMEDREFLALQIGTVMTKENYRDQGLAKKLIYSIIEDYRDKASFVYLFSNENSLKFYEKLGFKRIIEREYFMDQLDFPKKDTRLLPLESLELFRDYSLNRKPINQKFSVSNHGLDGFYFLLALPNMTYYLEEMDLLVMMEEKEGRLDLYDLISKKDFDLEEVLAFLVSESTEEIIFHFETGSLKNLKTRDLRDEDNALFLYGPSQVLESFKLPLTKQA